MKIIIFFSLLVASLQALSTPILSRQWSRSTLHEPHYKFRHQHRMSPLLTGDLVIQGNGIDGIKAFNRKSGHEVWGISVLNGVEGGAVVDGDRLYFGGNDGYFYAVNVHTGQSLWKAAINSESLTAPLVHDSFVYHVAGNNTLYAFDKMSGASLWVKTNSAKANMTVRGQTAPVYEKGILYLGFSDGIFAAFNAQNGRELWSKRIGDDKKFNDVDATAVLTSSCILVSSYANALYCLDKNSGSVLWRHDVGGHKAVLVSDNKIYYSTINKELHVLDADSGKLLRKVIDVKGLATSATTLENFVIYGESAGELVIRNKTDMAKVTSFNPGLGLLSRPTVDAENKAIYFVSGDANLYRFDLRETLDNPFAWSAKQYEKK